MPLRCRSAPVVLACALSSLVVLTVAAGAYRSAGDGATPSTLGAQHSYARPEDAAAALIEALQQGDAAAARAILGPAEQRLFERSGFDGVAREALAQASAERLVLEHTGDGCVSLRVGIVGWRFPIPIGRRDDRWSFVLPETTPSCAHVARLD